MQYNVKQKDTAKQKYINKKGKSENDKYQYYIIFQNK